MFYRLNGASIKLTESDHVIISSCLRVGKSSSKPFALYSNLSTAFKKIIIRNTIYVVNKCHFTSMNIHKDLQGGY